MEEEEESWWGGGLLSKQHGELALFSVFLQGLDDHWCYQ